MRNPSAFDYALVRIVPRVERQEFVNAGVVLFCLEQRFLAAKLVLQEERLSALWPALDVPAVFAHLRSLEQICRGAPDGGPIAKLSQRERFHWIVAPRSTVLQMSPVHSGLCENPEATLDRLTQELVAV